MSFKKKILPVSWKNGDKLTGDLNGIGFLLNGPIHNDAPIEETLIAASIEGMIRRDGRVMSLLTDWITIHASKINGDVLTGMLFALDPSEMRSILVYWCANAQRLKNDLRFERLRRLYQGPRIDYLAMLENERNEDSAGTSLLIRKNGEDQRFTATCMRVPNLVLRHRLKDVMTPAKLSKHHLGYRYRVMMGPTYRADIWALLRKYANLSVSELARRAHSSYNTAKLVKSDYELVKRDYSTRKVA